MSARVAGELSRFARTKITALGYVTFDDKSKPEALYGLKDRIYQGPSDIVLVSPTHFVVTLASSSFNQSIRRDLFDGVVRIRNLQKATNCLSSGGTATAWILTTCYYASFFAAVEILRCSGRIVSYFGEDIAEKITQRAAAPTPGKLEQGTYEGSVIYDSASGEVTVAYTKRNIRHHDFTWTQLKQIAAQSRRHLTGVDAVMHQRFERFIGTESHPSWPCPSDTRNRWNYEQAGWFGLEGEKIGAEFRKLANSRNAAFNWAGTNKYYRTEGECASSVAFVMNVLVGATEDLSGALLPDSLTKRREYKMIG